MYRHAHIYLIPELLIPELLIPELLIPELLILAALDP
jgi:hypothetical protein